MSNSSVRYVGMEEHGVSLKPVLGVRGTKYATCVVVDEETIRAVQVPLKDFDRSAPVLYKGRPYPVDRFIEHMERQARQRYNRRDMTQAARDAIARAQAGAGTEDVPPPLPEPTPPPARPEANLLSRICAELKIDPSVARRQLRKAGLKAPYDNEKLIRENLK